jgi:hypothetical protein
MGNPQPLINKDIYFIRKEMTVIGWIPNIDMTIEQYKVTRSQHFFFAKYDDDHRTIRGIFVGLGDNNNGVLIIKALPSDAINSSDKAMQLLSTNAD